MLALHRVAGAGPVREMPTNLQANSFYQASYSQYATANPRICRGVVSMFHCWCLVPDGNEDADVRLAGANTNLLLSNRRNIQRYTGVTRQSAIPIAVTAV